MTRYSSIDPTGASVPARTEENVRHLLRRTEFVDRQSRVDELMALADMDASFLVSVTGIDETLSEPVHARHAYSHQEVIWNARFVDMMLKQPDGSRAIDFSKLHDIEELPADAVELVVLDGQSAVGE